MKNWLKSAFIQFLSLVVAFSGLVYVAPLKADENGETSRLNSSSASFNFEGMPYKAQADKVTFSYTTLDGNKLEVEVPRDPKPERPSVLGEWLARQAKRGKAILDTQAHAAANSVRRFPTESLAFSVVLGTLAAAQLSFDESLNPVSIAQHVNSQIDPLTHVSFLGFMLANGAITEPWMAVTKSPVMAQFIPYLGMSAGMIASNAIHEIAALPHAWSCGAELKNTYLTGAAPKKGKDGRTECQKLEDFWMKLNFWDTFHQYCPSIMSMFASTFVSGYLQLKIGGALISGGNGMMRLLRAGVVAGNLRQAANGTTAGKIALEGLELVATSVGPGGWVKWGIRGAGKLVQIAAFIGLDMYFFQAPFANAYSNWDQGVRFNILNLEIMKGLIDNSKFSWRMPFPEDCEYRDKVPSEDDAFITEDERGLLRNAREQNGVAGKLRCMNDLEKSLRDFSSQMGKWQDLALRDILTSESAWEEKLSKLSAQYLAAKNFYSYFGNSIWDSQFDPSEKNLVQTFESTFPLNGIAAKGVESAKLYPAFLNQPYNVEEYQLATVKDVVTEFTQKLQQNTGDFKILTTAQKTVVQSILSELASGDSNRIGKAVEKLDAQFVGQSFRGQSLLPKPYADILTGIRSKLGNPKPIWKMGEGLVSYYSLVPDNQTIFAAAKFPKALARVSTTNPVEFLLASMVLGPDVEQNGQLITQNHGWSDTFSAPRIVRQDYVPVALVISRNGQSNLFNTVLYADPTVTSADNYNQQKQSQNPKVIKYSSIYEYLTKPNAYRSNVLNANKKIGSIDSWWDSKVEPQFASAWVSYETKYQENVAKMMRALWRNKVDIWNNGQTTSNKDSRFNPSAVSNSLIEAFRQERKLYLLILGEIFKSVALSETSDSKIPAALLAGPKIAVNIKGIDTSNKAKLDYVQQWGCVAPLTTTAGRVANTSSLSCLNDVTAAPEIYPLLAMLRQNDLLDMRALTKAWDTGSSGMPPLGGDGSSPNSYSRIFKTQATDQNLFFQNDVLKAFSKFESALRRIEPIQFSSSDGNYFATKSPLSNKEIESLYKDIRVELLKLRIIFSVRNTTVYKTKEEIREQDSDEMSDWMELVQKFEAQGIDPNAFREKAGIYLTDSQLAIAKQAFEGLSRQAMNLKFIGLTANAVSYREKTGGNYLINPRCASNPKGVGCKSIPRGALRSTVE